jgi:hypothetical protein
MIFDEIQLMQKNINWQRVRVDLDEKGFAVIPSLLTPAECMRISSLYDDEALFRATINMERYRFGKGQYRYFTYPLPAMLAGMRQDLYPELAPVANAWMEQLAIDRQYPDEMRTFLSDCDAVKQTRPTPLILRYEAGGFNTLHQDLYGDLFFPFQVVCMLSQPGKDFEGGELVFVEQLPRAQSRAIVLSPLQGDAVVFTTNFRPVKGTRGYYRAKMKHGVSPVREGLRYTLGIIFHDAK